jgi:predicted DsbA family dithiol-disulfide isomerase
MRSASERFLPGRRTDGRADRSGARPTLSRIGSPPYNPRVSPRPFAAAEPAPLVLYDDPLSPWSLVAERRVRAALEELGPLFAPLRISPFPLRSEDRALSREDRRALARAARKAAREPEASGTSPDLWLSPDPPLSSIPALTALVAARFQGADLEESFRGALRDAALVRGVNVARRDVLLELAERTGLDVRRFATALSARATEARVLEEVDRARDRGVDGPPALVVGEEWLVSGPRSQDEYRLILRRYAASRLGLTASHTVH